VIEEGKKKALKNSEMLIEGLGIEPISLTEQGMPASDLPALKKLCGNPKKGDYGIIGKIDIFT